MHAECITAASVISSALGVVVNALPPAATMGISNFLFSRAEGAVSMLQLSLQKLSWIGGSSYHPNIFNYAFCALGAVRMQRSSHPDAVMNEELVSMERRLKLCAYQLVRRSNQLLTIDGIAITCPAPSGKAREEHAGQLDAESSWYTSFSLSRLVQLSGLEDTVAAVGLGVPTALLEETSKSRSNSVLSTSECDNTAHSETAHLRAPILGTAKVAATIHPMLIFLLHELILFDGSSDCSRRTIGK